MLLALLAVTAAAAVLAACSSSGTSPAGSGGSTGTGSPAAAAAGSLKTATIGGATVLTSAKGFTLYSFAPDTPATSNCNGTCAQNWPPVKGPATAPGITGNGLNAAGGLWHEITPSGTAAPAGSSSSGSSGGGNGY